MKKPVIFGITCATLIITFIFASLYYKEQQNKKLGFLAQKNASTFVRDHSQTRGSDDAKVYLVEFMDPACETCAAFAPFVKKIMDSNPGRIKLILRYAPFHDGSEYFVKILEASKKQDKYWETLDIMFKSQKYWASHHNPQPEKLWYFLPKAGLDMKQLKKDIKDPALEQIIQQDIADAKTLNVRKTPGYFVNGKPLQKFGSQELYELIQSEIKTQYPN